MQDDQGVNDAQVRDGDQDGGHDEVHDHGVGGLDEHDLGVDEAHVQDAAAPSQLLHILHCFVDTCPNFSRSGRSPQHCYTKTSCTMR